MFKIIIGVFLAFTAYAPGKVIKQKIVMNYQNNNVLHSYNKTNYDKKGNRVSVVYYNAAHEIKNYSKFTYTDDEFVTITKDYTDKGDLEQTPFSKVNERNDKTYSKRTYHLRTPVAEYIDQYKYYYNKNLQNTRTERFSGPTMDTIDWVYNYLYNDEGLLVFTDSKFQDEKRDETEYFYKKGVLKKSVSYDYMNDGVRLPNSFAKYYHDQSSRLIKKKVKSCHQWKSPRGFKKYIYKYSFDKEGMLATDEFIREDKSFSLEKISYIYY